MTDGIHREGTINRRRWRQFSIRTVFAMMVVVAIVLGLRQQSVQRAAAQRELGRFIAAFEIAKAHSLALEQDKNFHPVLADLWDALPRESDIGRAWESQFVPAVNTRGQASSAFGQNGEAFQALSDGGFRYARPVRAERSCVVACHSSISQANTPGRLQLYDGATLGTISVTVSPSAP